MPSITHSQTAPSAVTQLQTRTDVLLALALEHRAKDSTYVRAVLNSYVAAKLARSKSSEAVSAKLDAVERSLFTQRYPDFSVQISQVRFVNALPTTDSSLPSARHAVKTVGSGGSTLTWDSDYRSVGSDR